MRTIKIIILIPKILQEGPLFSNIINLIYLYEIGNILIIYTI